MKKKKEKTFLEVWKEYVGGFGTILLIVSVCSIFQEGLDYTIIGLLGILFVYITFQSRWTRTEIKELKGGRKNV